MTNRPDNFMPDEWGSFQFTTSADAKRAEHMFNQLSSDRDRLRERVKELEAALESISDVLGTGAGECQANTCEGCLYEMRDAATTARSALSKSPK